MVLNRISVLSITILLVQVFDIAIHVGTNQIEPVRLLGSALIFIWLAYTVFRPGQPSYRNVSYGAIGAYVILNLIFIAENGLTNAEMGGAPRTTLFILVIVTVALSLFLARAKLDQTS